MALRERVSSKKLLHLKHLRTQSNPAQDISVRFFGLDWEEMREHLGQLREQADELSDLLVEPAGSRRRRRRGRREKGDGGMAAKAAQLVKTLNKVQEDLASHAEAVLSGRLNQEQQNDLMRRGGEI